MRKKSLQIMLLLIALCSLAGCGAQDAVPPASEEGAETRLFTDSAGRQVEVPVQIDRVALSGPMAQIPLFALCPDKLVGVSSAWTEEAEEYLDPKYFHMPEIGQLYGGSGTLDPETLLASGAQIVIDIGETKSKVGEDMDTLQEQTGVPFVHISATLPEMGDTYRTLGDLLNMQEEAETLAAYCEHIYQRSISIAERVDKTDILYIAGQEGLHVIARDSFHAEVLDLLANNLAVVDAPSSLGTGNEVDLEQIMNWDPEVIIFSPEGAYENVPMSPGWQDLRAIRNGAYYEVPSAPYNWLGFPPSVQRLLGMIWLPKVLYPEAADYDLYEEVALFYDLFYHCQLTQAQFDALSAKAIGR